MSARALLLLLLLPASLSAQIKVFVCDFGSQHPRTVIRKVSFRTPIPLPPKDERSLVDRLFREKVGTSSWPPTQTSPADGEELVREAYQDQGYLKVSVSPEVEPVARNGSRRIVNLVFQIDPGKRYRLGRIIWKGNSGIPTADLQKTMPIRSGETFSRKRIAGGLDNLRQLYESRGYINFTSIPTPEFNESAGSVSFEIDIDEGRQFHFGNLEVTGMRGSDRQILLSAWDKVRGQTYSPQIADRFFRQWFKPLRAGIRPKDFTHRHLDERTGSVDYELSLKRDPALDAKIGPQPLAATAAQDSIQQ